jgi:hypothetical protein
MNIIAIDPVKSMKFMEKLIHIKISIVKVAFAEYSPLFLNNTEWLWLCPV